MNIYVNFLHPRIRQGQEDINQDIFHFNVPGGRCETCSGDGFIKVEMQFLADLYLECEDCKGTRFKKEIREIAYRGKNMVDVLDMTVDEGLEFFEGNEKIVKYMQVLSDVGLGYIKLGQPSNTLSGGEAQRIKLLLILHPRGKENIHFLFLMNLLPDFILMIFQNCWIVLTFFCKEEIQL